jgi:hypothetical protein
MNDNRQADGLAPARRSRARRALLGLWVVVFVLAGIELVSRWDSLMSSLAGPRAARTQTGGPDR